MGIDFTLKPNWDGDNGAWAVTTPPLEYNWGGSYVHAATGTDNPEHVKDIILSVTADRDNLLKISKEYAYFAPVAENIKVAPLSAYDQGCVELIQNSFGDYLLDKIDYDKAKANFETAIKERYPEITEVQWSE